MALSHRGLEYRWSGITQSQPLRKIPGNFLITSSLNANHFLHSCTNTENMSFTLFLHINMHLRNKSFFFCKNVDRSFKTVYEK